MSTLTIRGIPVPNFIAAVISLLAFAGAQISEIVRGGISSIPKGQTAAAMALGLTFWPRLTRVVLPQAVARILPPLVNTTVEVVKGSSLVSLVSIVELTLATEQVVRRVQRPVPLYLTAALLYFMVNFIISSGWCCIRTKVTDRTSRICYSTSGGGAASGEPIVWNCDPMSAGRPPCAMPMTAGSSACFSKTRPRHGRSAQKVIAGLLRACQPSPLNRSYNRGVRTTREGGCDACDS